MGGQYVSLINEWMKTMEDSSTYLVVYLSWTKAKCYGNYKVQFWVRQIGDVIIFDRSDLIAGKFSMWLPMPWQKSELENVLVLMPSMGQCNKWMAYHGWFSRKISSAYSISITITFCNSLGRSRISTKSLICKLGRSKVGKKTTAKLLAFIRFSLACSATLHQRRQKHTSTRYEDEFRST